MVVANKRRALPRGTGTQPKPKKKSAKSFDVTVLARGMSSRCMGARIASQLTILSNDELEKDLRHMEAYQNACIAYDQQFFIHSNRSLVQSGHYGPITAPALVNGDSVYTNNIGDTHFDPYRPVMPVRIDPEEEKRISILRKRIASSEAQREVLETEYMSLRAHYVYASQRVKKSSLSMLTQLKLVKQLVQRRGQVVALRRVRVAVARDVMLTLERRTTNARAMSTITSTTTTKGPDMMDVWNEVEHLLRKAELSCRSLDLDLPTKRFQTKSPPPSKRKRGDVEEEIVPVQHVPWECRTMPRTPFGIPILVSQMSHAPDKAAGIGFGEVFGSKPSSMVFLEENLPSTFKDMEKDVDDIAKCREEAMELHKALQQERVVNKVLQGQIIQKRKRNDEMCAMMTLLRSETEAVLGRHNILLDTQEARQAASDLHQKVLEEREQRGENGLDVDEGELVDEMQRDDIPQESGLHEEHDNDGDDEGSGCEDEEEEGEMMEQPPKVFIMEEERVDNHSSI